MWILICFEMRCICEGYEKYSIDLFRNSASHGYAANLWVDY